MTRKFLEPKGLFVLLVALSAVHSVSYGDMIPAGVNNCNIPDVNKWEPAQIDQIGVGSFLSTKQTITIPPRESRLYITEHGIVERAIMEDPFTRSNLHDQTYCYLQMNQVERTSRTIESGTTIVLGDRLEDELADPQKRSRPERTFGFEVTSPSHIKFIRCEQRNRDIGFLKQTIGHGYVILSGQPAECIPRPRGLFNIHFR